MGQAETMIEHYDWIQIQVWICVRIESSLDIVTVKAQWKWKYVHKMLSRNPILSLFVIHNYDQTNPPFIPAFFGLGIHQAN